MTEFIYQERKCPQCGKEFICHNVDQWAYKRFGKVFCSWHCLRAWDAGAKTSKIDRREQIIQAIKDGLTTKEIVELVNADVKTVWYWRDKLKREGENFDGQG